MLNGLGLCLLAGRKSPKISILPASVLTIGSVLFPGVIFYSKIYNDRSYNKLIMIGGSASVLGWFLMILAWNYLFSINAINTHKSTTVSIFQIIYWEHYNMKW